MTTKVAASPAMETSSISVVETKQTTEKHKNGVYVNGRRVKDGDSLTGRVSPSRRQSKNRQIQPRPPLPTFPLEVGYREVYDPATGRSQLQPLTLLDILYPQEEDIGVVKVTQGPLHDQWSRWLADTLHSYLVTEGWLIMHDVLINWNRPGIPGRSPDVAVIHGGNLPAEGNESYHVGRDGPMPDFVIEITSYSTRTADLYEKTLAYAAVGVPEYLIIDKGTPNLEPWRLLGYYLGDQPFYEPIVPDAQGRITFAKVELQFEVIGRERVNVYDLTTGDRLLTPEEQKVYAGREAARAATEAARAAAEAARAATEAARADSEARLRELEAMLRQAGLQA